MTFLQSIPWQAFLDRGVHLFTYREDLNHPYISGNKLYKLTPLLTHYPADETLPVVSFGGPYSNHLHALGWLCHQKHIPVIGVVRGLHHAEMSPTLKDVQKWGMELHFVSRNQYREWCDMPYPKAAEKAEKRFGRCFFIPEGGATADVVDAYEPLAVKIYREIVPDYLFCATGTGSTVGGLFKFAKNSKVHGIQCVAEGKATYSRIAEWIDAKYIPPDLVLTDFHRGGFAKADSELLAFCREFSKQFNIPLEPIYTGKAFMAVYQLLLKNYFPPGSEVVVVHTGGLQGNRGFEKRLKEKNLAEFTASDWHFN
ncbi:1-aminocyclopropane-1-carboxylate deaminase/D-cysteine desulfhydrase [Gynuella sunshinyii]|uniref:1-aminocyclopropane-1-carboxylate deaminase n=1 Tax=Gynuella sunshinyii YC6258 TaxID=1445510 RepID=A0A0C5VMM0_9GAMM|nr:pyridoxal-phosphate dependent enzyme [Gynuella sunshinyii]AJQ94588.1 1-aminocyclopropane-1-carboxylate deaminase [Gynuella sunshinyii YC6258]